VGQLAGARMLCYLAWHVSIGLRAGRRRRKRWRHTDTADGRQWYTWLEHNTGHHARNGWNTRVAAYCSADHMHTNSQHGANRHTETRYTCWSIR